MRVVTVNWRFPAPSEPYVVDRVVALTERGVECVVVADKLNLRANPDVRRRLNGRVELRAPNRLRRRRHSSPLWFDRRADIVDFHDLHMIGGRVDLLRRLGAGTVLTCRGSEIRVATLASAAVRSATAEVLNSVDRVHCVSAELAERCVQLGADRERIHVAPFGVDLRQFAPRAGVERSTDLDTRIVSVGRLHWVKGYDYALQAVRLLRDSGRRVTYTIVGNEDGAEASVRLAVNDLGLGDLVTIAGHLPPDGVRAVLDQSDVFMLSSVSEGLSQATMEAMAVGLPVVVTDVGGMRELVHDGVHGRVVPSRDAAALAAAVDEILASDAGREMGRRGSEHVRAQYDSAVRIDDLQRLYADIAENRSR